MAICSWESSIAALHWFLRQFHLHIWTFPSLKSVQSPSCHSCLNFRYARPRQLNAFRGSRDLGLNSVFYSKQFYWAEDKFDVLSVACVAREMCYNTLQYSECYRTKALCLGHPIIIIQRRGEKGMNMKITFLTHSNLTIWNLFGRHEPFCSRDLWLVAD